MGILDASGPIVDVTILHPNLSGRLRVTRLAETAMTGFPARVFRSAFKSYIVLLQGCALHCYQPLRIYDLILLDMRETTPDPINPSLICPIQNDAKT